MKTDQRIIGSALIVMVIFTLIAMLAGCTVPKVEVVDLDGKSGTNDAFSIRIDPDARCPRAVFAQELYEALEKRDPVFAVRIRIDRAEQRKMEIVSHEIETQAAVIYCNENEKKFRRSKANSLFAGYDGLFSRWTVADIEAAMIEKRNVAIRWITVHSDDISGFDI